MRPQYKFLSAILFFLLLIFSCETRKGPVPIEYGKDSCAFCNMIITDAGFSAQLITKKGKVYKFDSIECLAAFVVSEAVKKEDIAGMWVADFVNKDKFIPAQQAKYLVSDKLRSPMGLNISAYSNEEDLKTVFRNFGGKVMTWEEVLDYVKERWKKRLKGH